MSYELDMAADTSGPVLSGTRSICNFLDQLLHPYKFNGRDMSGILFFILPVKVEMYVARGSLMGGQGVTAPPKGFKNRNN